MNIAKRKMLLSLLLLAAAIVLMALPISAVLTFAPSPTETVQKTFSYFDIGVFGMSGNPFPLLTGVLAVAAVVIVLWNFFAKEESVKRNRAAWGVALAALASSLGALMLLSSAGWAGIGISILLFCAFSMQKLA